MMLTTQPERLPRLPLRPGARAANAVMQFARGSSCALFVAQAVGGCTGCGASARGSQCRGGLAFEGGSRESRRPPPGVRFAGSPAGISLALSSCSMERLRRLVRQWGTPPDEDAALACLFSNLLVLPGLGSLMGGRRAAGWAQAIGSLGGFLLTLPFGLDFFTRWSSTGSFPMQHGPWLLWALAGLAAFGVSWTWSAFTSLALLRSAARPR